MSIPTGRCTISQWVGSGSQYMLELESDTPGDSITIFWKQASQPYGDEKMWDITELKDGKIKIQNVAHKLFIGLSDGIVSAASKPYEWAPSSGPDGLFAITVPGTKPIQAINVTNPSGDPPTSWS